MPQGSKFARMPIELITKVNLKLRKDLVPLRQAERLFKSVAQESRAISFTAELPSSKGQSWSSASMKLPLTRRIDGMSIDFAKISNLE